MNDLIEVLGLLFVGVMMLWASVEGFRNDYVELLRGDLFSFIISLFRKDNKRGILLIGRSAKIVGVTYGIAGTLLLLYTIAAHMSSIGKIPLVGYLTVTVAVGGFGLAWLVNWLDHEENSERRQIILEKLAQEDE